jgi:hypothetical protein
MMKRLLWALGFIATSVLPAAAAERCSHDAVTLRGVPVTIGFCIVGSSTSSAVTTVAVQATYSSKSASFSQHSNVRFITGEGPARALESIDLGPLGIVGVLHMTLLYDGNEVTMEHALLTPGAIAVK